MENQINHYKTKTFTVIIVQENNSQITMIIIDNNHLIEITIVESLQIEEIHKKNSRKLDIEDQTVKITNIEIFIQDQIQTEVIHQITIKIFLI